MILSYKYEQNMKLLYEALTL